MNNAFQLMNCIVVFNRGKDSVLFCKRKKEPYAGEQNIVHIINVALKYPIPER